MIFGSYMSRTNSALRWKAKPTVIFFTCCVSLIIVVTILSGHPNESVDLPPGYRSPDSGIAKGDNKKVFRGLNNDGTIRLLQPPDNDNDHEEKESLIEWDEPKFKSDPNSPGERGAPVKILAQDSAKIKESYDQYGFNQYISDKISLHRSVPDIRPIV